MPTNVLTLGQTDSNYDDLEDGYKESLRRPTLGDDIWHLQSKYGQGRGNNGRLTTDGLTVDNLHEGKVRIVNASFSDLDFRTGTAKAVETTNSTFSKGTEFRSVGTDGASDTNQSDSLIFGAQTKLTDVNVDLGNEDDYLQFKATSQSSNGAFNLGDGNDTVVFDSNSKVGDSNIVDLGDGAGGDGDADLVVVKNNADVKDLVIKNFESDDSLVIGGQTYTNLGGTGQTIIGGVKVDRI